MTDTEIQTVVDDLLAVASHFNRFLSIGDDDVKRLHNVFAENDAVQDVTVVWSRETEHGTAQVGIGTPGDGGVGHVVYRVGYAAWADIAMDSSRAIEDIAQTLYSADASMAMRHRRAYDAAIDDAMDDLDNASLALYQMGRYDDALWIGEYTNHWADSYGAVPNE